MSLLRSWLSCEGEAFKGERLLIGEFTSERVLSTFHLFSYTLESFLRRESLD